jgi:hypothetical protein
MAISPDRAIDQTITNNLHRLSKYGVLTARPRYEITDHQLTGRRAIVATVHTKKPMAGQACLVAKRCLMRVGVRVLPSRRRYSKIPHLGSRRC